MHSADYAVGRCLSVCLSVRHTPIFCRHTVEHILNFFTVRYSPTILVFPDQTLWQFRREWDPPPASLTVASNARDMKNRDFWPISRSISEMMQVRERAIVTMEGEYKTVWFTSRPSRLAAYKEHAHTHTHTHLQTHNEFNRHILS